MERTKVEQALASGDLWAAMRKGNYWRVRRNGKTQLWKTRPDDYRIPIKAGLRTYGEITQDSNVTEGRGGDFIISIEDPN